MGTPYQQLGVSPAASALRHRLRTQAVPFDAAGYRADIDGLRALAVVAVLLFHAKIPLFTGGFVGVDVFFVISGYLITSLMAKRMLEGRFTLLDFYERRVRRLFPALFAMLVGATAASLLLLVPIALDRFGQSLISTTIFASNVFFWQQSGYFDGQAELKVLLHTWSLAVEEQFYLGFPLVMLLVQRFLDRRWLPVIAVLAVSSFLLGLWALTRDASAAFYLAPFRVWELLIGSLLALGAVSAPASRAARELAAAAGLALVLGPVVAYSGDTAFPGVAALFPCLGTAMLIWAGTGADADSALPTRWLSWRPIVFVGLISYSLYLWHWPIFAIGRYYEIDELTITESVMLLALSFVVATLSWHFVERPFRRKSLGLPRRLLFAGAGAGMGGLALVGAAFVASGGWPQRFDPEIDRLADYRNSVSPIIDTCRWGRMLSSDPGRCIFGAGPPRILVWGDSHAAALHGTFQQLGDEGLTSLNVATPRCPPLLGAGPTRRCIEANARVLDYVRDNPELQTVVLAARWPFYLNGRPVRLGPAETNNNLPILRRERVDGSLETQSPRTLMSASLGETVSQLLDMERTVVVVYPIPATGYDIPSALARLASRGVRPEFFDVNQEVVVEWEAPAYSVLDGLGHHPNLHRVYPHAVLCTNGRCGVFRDREVLYSDSNHLSGSGGRLLVPDVRRVLALSMESTDPGHPPMTSGDD